MCQEAGSLLKRMPKHNAHMPVTSHVLDRCELGCAISRCRSLRLFTEKFIRFWVALVQCLHVTWVLTGTAASEDSRRGIYTDNVEPG